MERIRVTRSARKHAIGNAQMLAAMRNEIERTEDGDAIRIIGVDDRGIELEMIIVRDDRQDGWAIIHAMPTGYRRRGQ